MSVTVTSKVPNIICEPISHNFSQRVTPIKKICLHETGAHGDPQSWFNNPAAEASATYCIMANGQIKQYLSEEVKAWACGLPAYMFKPNYNGPHKPSYQYMLLDANNIYIDPNSYFLSIEFEKTDSEDWSKAGLKSLTSLMADIAHRYGFAIDREHVAGHHQIWDGHVCPGLGCPFDEIIITAAAKLAGLAPQQINS